MFSSLKEMECYTKVHCSLDRTRHPEDTIRPSFWKINIQQEFDLLERARRNVAD